MLLSESIAINLNVNNHAYTEVVSIRLTLADFLRDTLGLTGTHLGCEYGVCGCCTVLVDGRSVRSCLMFAVQANGAEITTVEGLAPSPGQLSAVQQAFHEKHGLQCGFCTPGMLITVTELLEEPTSHDEASIRERLAGVLCRCTGYQSIVEAALRAIEILEEERSPAKRD